MYRKNTALEPAEQARILRLYRWLYDQEPRRTLTSIAKELNICPGSLSACLRRRVMSRKHFLALRAIGIPADALPKPGFFVPGRKGGYVADDAAYE